MIETKIGLEAEFIILNSKGNAVIPNHTFDRDGFPLLGEIRGNPGNNVSETISNFIKRKIEVEALLKNSQQLVTPAIFRVPLKLYKEINKAINPNDKYADLNKVFNIYGTDISDFSDQIIKDGRIQGINVSCGLHIHFSCEETESVEVHKDQYSSVILPIKTSIIENAATTGVTELIQPYLALYRKLDTTVTRTLTARASRLNRVTIEYITKELDNMFFDKNQIQTTRLY